LDVSSENIQEFEQTKEALQLLCSTTGDEVPIPIDDLPEISISCDNIEDLTPETLANKIVDDLFQEYYYKSYDCDYFTCLRALPTEQIFIFVLSNQANQFYKEIFRYSIIAIAALATILIIVTKNRLKAFRKFGWSLFFSGLPYFAIVYAKDKLAQSISTPETAVSVQGVLTPIFETISNTFITVFIIGAILLLIGYFGVLFKFFKK
jgi:hypothetical protein